MSCMKSILILVSGMPATGKTSFASWLSKELNAPLVCYDNIKTKIFKSMYQNCKSSKHCNFFDSLPYDFFLFSIEEIMKSSALLIAEYFFTNQMSDILYNLTNNYKYETITIHMDTSSEVAYKRFQERNLNDSSQIGIRPTKISFEQFASSTKQNKDFRFGKCFIRVNTSDFSTVSYDQILTQIISMKEKSQ